MMYIKDVNSLYEINKNLIEKIKIGKENLDKIYQKESNGKFHINEMFLLKLIQKENPELIHNFPIMPHDETYKKFNMCFDPSSWGQNLGGTNSNHPPGFYAVNHYIGKYLKDNIYNIIFENKKPYIICTESNEKHNLFNLHIHSKKLKDYV